ncbi:hypothetical protein Agub_g5625 [Astrephomene gubernaculifera]|uniref:Uncharacterized protein n=1 Tax=Astrephomene gubernaculifera TaxID=47775 RepID=A0AAD3HKY8_9CHLO|nr:hypothetical protein Agub_g5625 [Astrephomene gubernaculifera]
MGSDSLLVEQLQASTAVQHALAGCFLQPGLDGHSGPKQLIVNCGDYLQLWEIVDGSVEFQQNFHLFERVEHIDLVPSSLQLFGPDSTDALLVFTFDGRCALFRLLPQPQPQQYQQRKPTAIHAVNGRRDLVLTEAACLALPLPNLRAALLPKRLEGVCSSGIAPVARRIAAATGARGVVVAAIHMDLLHVITLHAAPSEGEHPLLLCTAVPIADTPLYGMPPGLHMLHTAGPRPWSRPLDCGLEVLPLPNAAVAAAVVPSVQRYLPYDTSSAAVATTTVEKGKKEQIEPEEEEEDYSGLLFVGSSSSNSQVLAVPAACTSPACRPAAAAAAAAAAATSGQPSAAAPSTRPARSPLRWPLAEVAAIKSLGPVMDAVVVPDAEGCDDPWLVASCGHGPVGRLIRGRMAAGLQPYMEEGPQVPVSFP